LELGRPANISIPAVLASVTTTIQLVSGPTNNFGLSIFIIGRENALKYESSVRT